jgi:hypothetical protein
MLMHPQDKNNAQKKAGRAIISDKVKSYSDDPFVIKKGKQSKEFLDKHGFPKELLTKK